MVVAAFLLDIFVFLFSSYVPEVHPYRWKFFEGHLSRPSTYLTDIHPIREEQPPRIVFLHSFLTWSSILGSLQSFIPPRTYPHHQIGPKTQYTNLGPCPHIYRLLMHYKNKLKVLYNRNMVKHVKYINLKLFIIYSRKINLRVVVRERGKTCICHCFHPRTWKCDSYTIVVWDFALKLGFL